MCRYDGRILSFVDEASFVDPNYFHMHFSCTINLMHAADPKGVTLLKTNKKWSLTVMIIGLIGAALIIGMIIPRETQPSADTRIILEHTYQTYIAPICFEASDPTNFLEEATLKKAESLNYPPHSSCTEKALESESDRFIPSLLKEIGIMDKKWDS